MNKINVDLKAIIIPIFLKILKAISLNKYTHYWLRGGRGSTKSSFAALAIIICMMDDYKNGIHSNCVALRKVKDTLKDSVFENFNWAIEVLKVGHLWDSKISPTSITFIPSGQKILFRGADKPKKIKSTKFKKGYCKYIWYEELDEFTGMEEIRNINQSLMRGGRDYCVIYTYNPPKQLSSWVNIESECIRKDRLVVHSTYKDIPIRKGIIWLGRQFYIEVKELRLKNFKAYEHEYLGKQVGVEGIIFPNVVLEEITDKQIEQFDNNNKRRGLDWGYSLDPAHYGEMYFDRKRMDLYIYFEIHQIRLSNKKLFEMISRQNKMNGLITCDSQEPKSIQEGKDNGLRIKGAKKGPDSIDYGIKFLQDLNKIIIDSQRCPNTAREFKLYELQKDKNGNYINRYPDKDNHSIDMCRYALEDDMKNNANDCGIT
jgi:PBSX family phage terminase large subunit